MTVQGCRCMEEVREKEKARRQGGRLCRQVGDRWEAMEAGGRQVGGSAVIIHGVDPVEKTGEKSPQLV